MSSRAPRSGEGPGTERPYDGLAVAALVWGIVGLPIMVYIPFLGLALAILATVLGTMARKRIGAEGGKGKAVAAVGIGFGVVGILFFIVQLAGYGQVGTGG